ncbi:MAG: AEC family transporter [Anaerolineae bacterium]|nr:AEC family transporter [Anaerolineae bacterium]
MATLEITYNILIPIFLIAGVFAVLDRHMHIDPQPASRMVVYVFAPALIFRSLAFMEISAGEAGLLFGSTVIITLLAAGLGNGFVRVIGFDRRQESAFTLSLIFANLGNYGLPLNRLAFGDPGLERAVICMVASLLMGYTIGIFFASRGNTSNRSAMLNVLKNPMPYAAAFGLLFNAANLNLPDTLVNTLNLAAQAAEPLMLAVLGIQLSRTWQIGIGGMLRFSLFATIFRLIVAPLIAFPITALLGMSGITRDVAIVQTSMPTAVLAGVLATEFGADAESVTATILISTLTSIITLSVLLSILL